MSVKPKLYYMMESPPCRTPIFVANILNIDLELVRVDLSVKQHLTEEIAPFLPFKKIPAFVDVDGFVLGESRSIAKYLVEKYCDTNRSLYPTDLKANIIIDQFLQFDIGTLYRVISDIVFNVFSTGKPNLDKLPNLMEVLKSLEDNMKSFSPAKPFLVNGSLTLADISIFNTLTMLDCIQNNMDWDKVPKIRDYFAAIDKELKKFDKDDAIEEGRMGLKAYAESLIQKAK